MSEFEKWFKTTSAYRMLEAMNYYKMDLFHWVEGRGEYRHSSVQIAFMTWVEQQSEIDQLKAKNTALVHALVNTNAEKTKWAHDYWAQVERTAEYGAMLISNPDSLEFSCFKKEKEIEKLKAEKAGLKKTIQDALEVIASKIGDCRITENSRNFAIGQQNTAFLIREELQILEDVLRGEHE